MSRRSRRIYRLYAGRKESGFQEALFIRGSVAFRNPDLRPCPCGEIPVIQQSVYAQEHCWIIRCPKCDLRATSEGDYDRVRRDWNTGHFSEATLIVASPLVSLNRNGMIALAMALELRTKRDKKKKLIKKEKARRERLKKAV